MTLTTINLSRRLVVINDVNGIALGSGVLVNNKGLIISCYHNFFDEKTGLPIPHKNISIKTSLGAWQDIQYSKNIEFCFNKDRDSKIYQDFKSDDIFLVRLKVDNSPEWLKDLTQIEVTQDIKADDEIAILAGEVDEQSPTKSPYDKKYIQFSSKVIASESATQHHPHCFHIKLDGYPGYSGGGVFKQGKLAGIINYAQTRRQNNIIASLIPNYIIDYINKEINQPYLTQTSTNTNTILNPINTMPQHKIANISKVKLVKIIEKRFRREEIGLIWLELLKSNMDNEMPHRTPMDCITQLLSRCQQLSISTRLYQELIDLHPEIEQDALNP